MNWWNSIETLQRLVSALNWSAGIATFLAAIGFLFALRLNGRVEDLRAVSDRQIASRLQATESQLNEAREQAAAAVRKQEEAERAATEKIAAVQRTATVATERAAAVAQQQRGRSLSEDQARRFLSGLQSGTKGKVDVSVTLGDTEAHAFAEQLDQLLKRAGFSTDGVSQAVFSGPNEGVVLLVQDRTKLPAGFETLANAFRAAGIEVQLGFNPTKPPEATSLIVGMKPALR